MKRASYREGVEWIAENDDPGSSDSLDEVAVADYISTSLLADIYGVGRLKVAKDVIKYRIKNNIGEVNENHLVD